jgi:hypothetical protein
MSLKPPRVPRISGTALTAVRAAAEAPGLGDMVFQLMRKSLRVDHLERLPPEIAGELPLDARPLRARRERTLAALTAGHHPPPDDAISTAGVWPRPSSYYVERYTERSASPIEVIARALKAIDEVASRKPTMNVVAAKRIEEAMREAKASSERYASGRPQGRSTGSLSS